jgi:hypothetical protein
MGTIDFDGAVCETLFATNAYVMRYVMSSDPKELLKAIELQADALRLLHALLVDMEDVRPCPN